MYNRKRVKQVKVFISWSGSKSKKIAETLKDWIKCVIQSVEPFVSSEDIHKGERWSNDIAKELEQTHFGILCVTKDNFEAPWLLFEAGALSKAMDKALVAPLLFDLKHSDLSGSPLLQFQATTFSKEEIKKLITTMNEKTEHKLDGLDKVFEKWYPELEEAIKSIISVAEEKDEEDESVISSQVLEEILSLSRDNLKLLKTSENRTSEDFTQVVQKLDRIYNQNDRNEENMRRKRKVSPMMIDEWLHMGRKEMGNNYGFLILLSFFREDFPWIYDLGKELFDVLKSEKPQDEKEKAVRNFKEMVAHTEYFSMRFYKIGNKEDHMFLREMPMMLMRYVDDVIGKWE